MITNSEKKPLLITEISTSTVDIKIVFSTHITHLSGIWDRNPFFH